MPYGVKWEPAFTVSLNMESYQQDQEGMSIGIAHYPIMANTELIPSNPKTSNSHKYSGVDNFNCQEQQRRIR